MVNLSQVGLLAFCSTASSFSLNGPVSQRGRHQQLNMSDRGWDNSNYLDALSGGQESIEEANERYKKEAAARAHMKETQFQSMTVDFEEEEEEFNPGFVGAYVDESPIAVPAAPAVPAVPTDGIEENPSGGQRFQNMMAQAKKQQGFSNVQAQQQQQMQQQQEQQPAPPAMPIQTPTPPPQQTPTVQPPMNQPAMDPQAYYQALQAWQQAMVTFQQFAAANPEAASKMTPPLPPPPPPTFTEQTPQQAVPQQAVPQQQYQAPPQQQPQPQVQPIESSNNDGTAKDVHDYLPKRAGGNNDAYEVNNPADVYFAQLKRDSSVRIDARKRGDMDTANAPFEEEGVIALGGFFSDELMRRRREQIQKNGGEFETSRDEMILPSHFQGNEQGLDKSYTGASYKQKLMEAKKNRSN